MELVLEPPPHPASTASKKHEPNSEVTHFITSPFLGSAPIAARSTTYGVQLSFWIS